MPYPRPIVGLVAALMLCGALVTVGRAADTRPNIVIIYADDLGNGDLACYGHPRFKTPNLDRLAAQGARLTSFYTCCPFCAPSRAGLQTGRYPFRTTVTGNPSPDGPKPNNHGLPPSELTLGEMLKSAGYATCCVGKWHLGHSPEFYPTRQGYDEYLGILYSNDMRPVELFEQEKVVEYPVVQATLTRRYTERAIDFIRRHRDKPFFLYLPHAMPHKPLACSESYYQKSGAGLYGDVIAELDWSIGEVLRTLDDEGLAENTLVLFSSDNGPWYGGSTGGLRGMKGAGFEGGIRVPLIARWPGHIPAGGVREEAASIVDVFPTVLAAAGVALPTDRVIDGRDLTRLLAGSAGSPHQAILTVNPGGTLTIRADQWKLHLRPTNNSVVTVDDGTRWIDPRAPDGVTILAPFEQYQPTDHPGVNAGDTFQGVGLFNLATDPSEQHNVADAHPEIVARLKKLAADIEANGEK